MCEKKAGAGLVRHQVLGDLARSAGQLALIGRTCARNAASQTQKRTRVLQLNTTANALLWQCRGGGQEAEAERGRKFDVLCITHTHTVCLLCLPLSRSLALSLRLYFALLWEEPTHACASHFLSTSLGVSHCQYNGKWPTKRSARAPLPKAPLVLVENRL